MTEEYKNYLVEKVMWHTDWFLSYYFNLTAPTGIKDL